MHTPSDWIIATHVHAHASTPGPCATRARMTETLYKDRDATQTGGVKSNDGDHLAGTAKAKLTKERKCKGKNDKKATQSEGFEPARGDPNRFQVCRLNHSATIADDKEVNQVDRIQVPLVHREGESPDIEAREGRPSPVHSCVHSHVFSHPVRNPGRNCHVLRCRLCRRRHAVSAAGSPHRCAGARAYVTMPLHACMRAAGRMPHVCAQRLHGKSLLTSLVYHSVHGSNVRQTVRRQSLQSVGRRQACTRDQRPPILSGVVMSVRACYSAERVVLRSIGHGSENGNPVRGGERNGALVLSGRRRT